MKQNLYKDKIHQIAVVSSNSAMAWALIRNKCHELAIEVPSMDQVELVKELEDRK